MRFLVALFVLINIHAFSQTDDASLTEIKKFQDELNEDYKNKETSPLDAKSRKHFKEHTFFKVDLKYRVTATLRVSEPEPFFQMKTSSLATRQYRVYGILEFTLEDRKFKIPVYQSQQLMKTKGFEDHLFFPFTDLTSGEQSYGGGRYIDLHIPKEGNIIVIDFNQAYNPYCAYKTKVQYSCPIVPAENNLDIKILAGVAYTPKK
ncbi:MAG: DUF1684 domain-containing protein [Chryseolinea sp.]